MIITKIGDFYLAVMEDATLNEKDREDLAKLAPEGLADELLEMVDEADEIAKPISLFAVCPVTDTDENGVTINGVRVDNPLVLEKLGEKKRCFPYLNTCGRELEAWSEQYKDDPLGEFWADEIKKRYLYRVGMATMQYIQDTYHLGGHRAALNPGSRQEWPVSGQKELFEMLGGAEFVKEQIGVTYTNSFLMLPTKTTSGIIFESETFYVNCQYCPLEDCPNRRAPRIQA